MRDITERKQLEQQLAQAQKLEAVGQLAGGIAHDFNNILQSVLSYSQLAQKNVPESDRVHGYLQEIERAGERAAHLTQQLMTFSRHQISEPRVLSLNLVILEGGRMLRRLISEDIELVTLPDPSEPSITADSGQIEQIVVNMAVNARDAMPGGGRLIIETQAVTLDEAYARVHAEASPGEYVMLRFTDTGVGMTDDVKARTFEPFFTTKEVGKGTGLGLSTCYGIVTQSDGHITVDSVPDEGTTFRILLPRAEREVDAAPLHDDVDDLPVGSETLMLVEDEVIVREVVSHILREQGYAVIEATNGVEALRIAEDSIGDEIRLLITDIVMPLMGGVELVERFRAARPDVKVLYVSGYIDGAVINHVMSADRAEYMQKPFTHAALARKVRELLDQ